MVHVRINRKTRTFLVAAFLSLMSFAPAHGKLNAGAPAVAEHPTVGHQGIERMLARGGPPHLFSQRNDNSANSDQRHCAKPRWRQ